MMKFTFRAKIEKAGINPCVTVPPRIHSKLKPEKGYIPVKGTINGFFFQQTLCPVKEKGYRLYVNVKMLKGAGLKNGQLGHFEIEPDSWKRNREVPMPPAFRKKLKEARLLKTFLAYSPSRQKEVNRYLNNLKTKEALLRNMDKIIRVMQGQDTSPILRKK